MNDPDQPPTPDHLTHLLEEANHEETVACLDRLGADDTETRKRGLRAVRDVAAERPRSVEELIDPLSTFLLDEDRAVRLTTAKLFVTLAQSEPAAVLSIVDVLADRLADEDEFYYVRARCAEALGYVAVEAPEEVTEPDTLADLRIGLSFDEPEVKEKLAKALEYVALGNPDRLRHHVSNLADHLNDENELVRYHLCTTLVVVGSAYPERLMAASEALSERLADENPYVRGRAVEALGVLGRSRPDDVPVSTDDIADIEADADESFVADRIRFARNTLSGSERNEDVPERIGTLDGICGTTDDIVEEITSPDGDRECPQCGLALSENGPPMCPRCGAPY